MMVMSRKRALSDAFGSPSTKQMRVGASCSPHKIAFLDLADHSARRAKRTIQMMEENGSQGGRDHKALRSFADANVPRGRVDCVEGQTFAAQSEAAMASAFDENLEADPKKAKLCRNCKARPGEHLFTGEDVRQIVDRAVAKREGEVRQEFEAVLQAKMAEQFNNFRRFHEDYVSRQLNQSDYSYMS